MAGKIEDEFTVVHLCAALMFKNFTRKLEKCTGKIRKHPNFFIKKCFASLQNAPTLKDAVNIFRDMCQILLEERKTPAEQRAEERLMRRIQKVEKSEIEFEDTETDEDKSFDASTETGNQNATI